MGGELRSRIRPWFDAGTVITTPRHQVDVIVTEYGTAELLGLNRAHCRIIPKLYRASGLWLVGGRALVVHHRLAPAPSPERWIVDTDGAMLGLGAERRRA